MQGEKQYVIDMTLPIKIDPFCFTCLLVYLFIIHLFRESV